jgi:hypothetical protein
MAKELKKKRVAKLPMLEKARVEFKKLLITNPNYFGTAPKVKIKPVLQMKYNTKYEEVACVGFYPESDLLEAIINVKLAAGYNGDLCSQGSFEYVRFFVDWDGDGDFADPDEDVGITSVNVHDIPGGDYPCLDGTKPLSYAVTLRIDSRKRWCTLPNLVKVRAILSWNAQPTAGDPNYPPVWGNVVDKWVQIKPTAVLLGDVIKAAALEKLKLETKMLDLGTPISKIKALTPIELRAIYKGKGVPEHRFNLAAVSQIAQTVKLNPSLMAGFKLKLDPKLVKIIESVEPVLAEKPNTKYEELHCVGLNYNMDTLVATLTVKLPYGYSGGLCTAGSQEYVAFWAYVWDQIEGVCWWKYLGTASVNVHDIATIPSEGLQYAVYLPVDLSNYKDKCNKPKVIRIRAILSWQTPPSIYNPSFPPVWGNTVDALIQLKPSPTTPEPGEQKPYIWAVGEMAVESISGNPYTIISSTLGEGYANGISVNGGFTADESPFGSGIAISGTITNAPKPPGTLRYKVQYSESGKFNWHDITNQFRIWIRKNGVPSGFIDQIADPQGYFKYQKDLNPPVTTEVQDDILAQWSTPVPEGDGLYDLIVLLYQPGAPGNPALNVPADNVPSEIVKVMVDNTRPNASVSLNLGPCTKYTVGDTINGTFTATDEHIKQYTLTIEPGPPSAPNPPTISPTGETYPALIPPGLTNEPFKVITTDKTTPCGYVIVLQVWDRTITNNSYYGNYNYATVGLCLLEKGILKK